jgi:hypothetical protein
MMPVVPMLMVLLYTSIPNSPINWSADASKNWIRPDVPSARRLMIGVDVNYSEEEDTTAVPLYSEEVVEEDDATFINCALISSCTACTDTDRSDVVECSATGRIETYRCIRAVHEDHVPYRRRLEEALDNSELQQQLSIFYRSCARTKTEQEFMFIQFQVFCGFIGCLSAYSIRKQKMTVATLFDQRRMNQAAANPRRGGRVGANNTSNSDGIEMKTTRSSNPAVLRQASSVHGNSNDEMKSLLSSSNPVNVV